jgi:hypothetical protein
MDVETTADRFVGIDVSKARVDVQSDRMALRLVALPTRKVWAHWSRDCSRCRPVW